MEETKKSSVDLTGLAIGIIILGLVVAIGSVITFNVAKSQITNAATYQTANESVSPTTAGTVLAKPWVQGINTVYNDSNGVIISSGNYSLSVNSDTGAGSILNSTCKVSTASGSCTAWKVTYTAYNTSDPRFSVPNNATVGLASYGDWFKIIVIVTIAAVIIGLIYSQFGKGSGNSASGGY